MIIAAMAARKVAAMAKYIECEALISELNKELEGLRNIYRSLPYNQEKRVCAAQLVGLNDAMAIVMNQKMVEVEEDNHE